MTAASPAQPASTGRSSAGRWAVRLAWYLPAILVFVGTIALWQVIVSNLDIQGYPLPTPSAIASALVDNWGAGRWPLGAAAMATLFEALGGLLIGTVAGVAVALFTARFVTARELVLPFAIGASAVPIIAFAPIFGVWFNPISAQSKMAVAGVLCFLPVMVNTLRGLQSAKPRQIELMRSYAASELEIWRRVRVPTALPFVFTSLKVASVLSMIGAIVGEYFGGALNALGVLINTSAGVFQFDTAWAGILVASLLGIALYSAVVAAERAVLRWSPQAGGS